MLQKTVAPTVTASLTFITGTSPSDNITSNSELNGTGLPNTVVKFTIDGSPIASSVMADAQGTWSFKPSGLADGPHTIVASQTDTFGNTGTTSLSFTVDTVAPAFAISSAGGSVNQATQTITGTVDVADATVTIFDGSTPVGSAVVQGNGSWRSSVTLSNGSNSLTAQVTDLISHGPVTLNSVLLRQTLPRAPARKGEGTCQLAVHTASPSLDEFNVGDGQRNRSDITSI